jgi:hypothetical protein
MATSDASWSGKLRLIGDLERPDHWHLGEDDRCAYFGEYTARAPYSHSSSNQLIHNLKKPPETRGTYQWAHKVRAIQDVARALAANLTREVLGRTAFVPMPPSKPPNSSASDDRMDQVARSIGETVDVRDVFYTSTERPPMHANQGRRDPMALRASLAIRAEGLFDEPTNVVLLDDVLTTGCSFIVCKAMLSEHWPQAKIVGIFAARRVIERPTAADVFGSVRFE